MERINHPLRPTLSSIARRSTLLYKSFGQFLITIKKIFYLDNFSKFTNFTINNLLKSTDYVYENVYVKWVTVVRCIDFRYST